MWSVAALALAAALTPMYVSLCGLLSRSTGHGARRLIATARGVAELDRLRAGGSARIVDLSELPGGRCEASLDAGRTPGLRGARVVVTWHEEGRVRRAEWVTLLRSTP